MPKFYLNVPHYKQQTEVTCVPACVKMVLAYWGRDISEQELSNLMKTRTIGTFAEDVHRISKLGFSVNLSSSSLAELKVALDANKPAIAFLHTAALSYWTVDSAHALVVIGYDEDSIYVNDPYFDNVLIQVPLGEFMQAWFQTDYLLATIDPLSQD